MFYRYKPILVIVECYLTKCARLNISSLVGNFCGTIYLCSEPFELSFGTEFQGERFFYWTNT